ncbi:hypothetical protein HY772_02535 [Candidatus Woesearchaeota archaeon]|nr:hypothetical protein [Candidatus Woesearchaeota archaeon]
MSDDNPFDRLGLNKSIVEYLSRTGLLEGFLKDYFRITQTRLHPDKGGDTELCKIVNIAYSEICQKPDRIDNWVASMQNGNSNAEHLAVIEALVEQNEQLQHIERDYEKLKRRHAELLANGSGVDAQVRKARKTEPSTASRTSPRTAPKVSVEDPEIKTSPKASARRETTEESARASTPKIIIVEPILLEGLTCVGSDGKIFEKYDKLWVDGDVIRNPREFYSDSKIHKHISFTPYQAISHLEKSTDGRFVPSFALHCGILENLFRRAIKKRADGTYETLDPQAKAILNQYKNYGPCYGWHNNNTIVDGSGDRIIHYPHDDDFPTHGGTNNINTTRKRTTKPYTRRKDESDSSLENALKDTQKRRFVQDLTGREHPEILIEIGQYFSKTAWLYPPSKGGTWAAWLGCYDLDPFGIDVYDSLDGSGAARGVR